MNEIRFNGSDYKRYHGVTPRLGVRIIIAFSI